jgi:hypothetical protein
VLAILWRFFFIRNKLFSNFLAFCIETWFWIRIRIFINYGSETLQISCLSGSYCYIAHRTYFVDTVNENCMIMSYSCAQDDEDDWETDPDYVNNMSEEQQR